ncbi:hypothetical protein BU17DRAFT_89795 [Hysterangium stoloniferum]|nr:hypothetical protein BU17DRAFT_89795 [Hysterangium stoloniferum]
MASPHSRVNAPLDPRHPTHTTHPTPTSQTKPLPNNEVAAQARFRYSLCSTSHMPRSIQDTPLNEPMLQMFTPQDRDSQFWWTTTGKSFSQMMHRALYPVHQQYRYFSFFYMVILPELGPAPVFDMPS